jgi:hypothetical protein
LADGAEFLTRSREQKKSREQQIFLRAEGAAAVVKAASLERWFFFSRLIFCSRLRVPPSSARARTNAADKPERLGALGGSISLFPPQKTAETRQIGGLPPGFPLL